MLDEVKELQLFLLYLVVCINSPPPWGHAATESLKMAHQWSKQRGRSWSGDRPAHWSWRIHGNASHYAWTRVRVGKWTTSLTSPCKHRKPSKALLVRRFYQRSFRSIRVSLFHPGENQYSLQSTFRALCQHYWLLVLSADFTAHMKVQEHQEVSEHQRQRGAPLHCSCTCTSVNWFSTARHTATPQDNKQLPEHEISLTR